MEDNINIKGFAPDTRFEFYRLDPPFLRDKQGTVPIGLDVGYSTTKIFSIFGKHIFPSFPVKINDDNLLSTTEPHIKYKDEKGNLWYVGDAAYDFVETRKTVYQENALFGRSRIKSEEYLVLLRVGLLFGLLQDDFTIPDKFRINVKTGLPDQYIMSDRRLLKERFVGNHNYSVKIGDNDWIPVNIIINEDDISVVSQPFGTLWSLITDIDGNIVNNELLSSTNILIFDGGYHTIDTFFNKSGCKGTSSTWTDIAMNEVFKRTANKIYTATQEKVSLRQYELIKNIRGVDSRSVPGIVPFKNQKYSYEQDLTNSLEEVAKEAINQLLIIYEDLDDISVIVCTGGTGKAFYPIFKKNLHVDVILAEKIDGNKYEKFNTVFSNAIGFYKCLATELAYDNEQEEEEEEKKEEVVATANTN